MCHTKDMNATEISFHTAAIACVEGSRRAAVRRGDTAAARMELRALSGVMACAIAAGVTPDQITRARRAA